MPHLDVPQFLGILVVMLGSAKLLGAAAARLGQPAVLGELLAGVLVGTSVLGWVDPKIEVVHLLAELGVLVLLFEIGLETDLGKLLSVGGTATVVAVAGVALPFAMGYAVCKLLGQTDLVAVVAGAALTATSVGITARVLSDLGRLQDPESQVVLGAAVIDDVIGLIILTVVAGMANGGGGVEAFQILEVTGKAFGFLAATLAIGYFLVPALFRLAGRVEVPGFANTGALILAFGLAWLAHRVGSATIIGAFAAGLLLARAPQAHALQQGVTSLGYFFVPLFFVSVGAQVDVRALNPADPANWGTLQVGGLLVVVAVLGKVLAGYAPFWFRGKKLVVGVGMVPRGEVGLIFAQMGLASGVFDAGLFGAVTFMVVVTTFLAPPLLKVLFPPRRPEDRAPEPEGVAELVTEP